jgi:hypothetical protein
VAVVMVSSVAVVMVSSVAVVMVSSVAVVMVSSVAVVMVSSVAVVMVSSVAEMHVKFYTFDFAALGALGVQVVAVKRKLGQFLFQARQLYAQVQHRADKHVAADAAEDVEI